MERERANVAFRSAKERPFAERKATIRPALPFVPQSLVRVVIYASTPRSRQASS